MGMIVDFLNHIPFADMNSGLAILPPLTPPDDLPAGPLLLKDIDVSGRVDVERLSFVGPEILSFYHFPISQRSN